MTLWNLSDTDEGDDSTGNEHGPQIVLYLFVALQVIGHDEVDDHVFKIFEDKKEACDQVNPSEYSPEQRGNQADDDVEGNGFVQWCSQE